ncbi:unnamed protein product [Linum tenue]|uniref:Uncharacterized protein n=1 Tax=Linum tenue TaxID=586396 RepID=A0AAV0RJ71_9ROSI|nr:unnamed protein product [Linum tenue]
MEHMSSGVRSS